MFVFLLNIHIFYVNSFSAPNQNLKRFERKLHLCSPSWPSFWELQSQQTLRRRSQSHKNKCRWISSSALTVSWHSWRRVSSNTRFVYRSETRRSRYCNAWRFVAHTEPVVAAYVPPPRRCDLCANNESERVSASGRGRAGGRVCLSLRLAVCECLGDCNSNRSHFNLCPWE